MTKKNAKKHEARERQAVLGGKYTTHHRAVSNTTMHFNGPVASIQTKPGNTVTVVDGKVLGSNPMPDAQSPIWLQGPHKSIWKEDPEARYVIDAERLAGTFQRVYGRKLPRHTEADESFDLGDVVYYRYGHIVVVHSIEGDVILELTTE